jgi:hypothetical protein
MKADFSRPMQPWRDGVKEVTVMRGLFTSDPVIAHAARRVGVGHMIKRRSGMKKLLVALSLAAAGASAFAGPSVGVSVSVNQPGVYGRVDIGSVPTPPVLLYPQPVVIVPGPVAVQQRPIYLHVPPGYERDWHRRCREYAACGQPVYFVRDDWYREHYHRAERREERREDRRDDRHDDHHDRGRGHGRGHDKDRH